MKKTQDERGNLVRMYEAGDGMRRRFYDALEESRFSYPRANATKHALRWYCDGHMEDRPVSGIWACAVLAEHLLSLAKRNDRRGTKVPFADAARFYASTRRAMRNVLSHHKVTTRMTRKGVEAARTAYLRLCSEGTETLAKGGAE